jgi:hypothetical protein
LFPPDDERLSLETCRGRKINTLKKVKKKCVRLVVNPDLPQDARSTKYKITRYQFSEVNPLVGQKSWKVSLFMA